MNLSAQPDGIELDFPEGATDLIKAALAEHDYQYKEELGAGGFSKVFLVYSLRYKSDFAAKVTNNNSSRHRSAPTSYSNEYHALASLNHPHIIRLYDSFSSGDYSFLILEYCQGKSLRDQITLQGLPEAQCRTMMRQLIDAVAHMHSFGFVHRDIKPGNVLLDSYGRPKLADFGLAMQLKRGQFLHDHAGSPQYMSPEIVRKPVYDPFKADVWALGVTFHEMAIGLLKWPKKKTQVETVILNASVMLTTIVPMSLAKVVRSMTAVDPEDRPTMDKLIATKVFDDVPAATAQLSGSSNGGATARGQPSTPKLGAAGRVLTPAMRHNSSLCMNSQRRSVCLFPARVDTTEKAMVVTARASIAPVDPRKRRSVMPVVPQLKKGPMP